MVSYNVYGKGGHALGIAFGITMLLLMLGVAAPASAMDLNATTCDSVPLNGTWNAGTNTCTVSGVVGFFDSLNIPAGTILNNTATIINYGTINNDWLGTITNYGTINNTNGGIINNYGTIMNIVGTINNYGTINTYTSANTINNGGIINNDDGTIIINNGGTIINNGGTIINKAGGTIFNKAGGTIFNNGRGTIINKAGGTIINKASGTIDNNYGTIINLCQGIIYEGAITGSPVQNACLATTIVTLQGKLTNSTTGNPVQTGSIRVTINDDSGKQIWQDTFNNTIDNGVFNIPLGAVNELKLVPGTVYQMVVEIDAHNAVFTTADVTFGDDNPVGDVIKFKAP